MLVRDVYDVRAGSPVMPSFLWNSSSSSGSKTAVALSRKQNVCIGRCDTTGVLLADEYVAVRVNGKNDTDDSATEWLFVNVSRGEPLREYLSVLELHGCEELAHAARAAVIE